MTPGALSLSRSGAIEPALSVAEGVGILTFS